MFEKVNTLAVYVSDKEKSKRFYTEILGFEVSADLGPKLCFLRSENGMINIYLNGGMKQHPCGGHHCRLSFFLRAEKSAGETFAVLKKNGVTLLQDQPEQVDDNIACFQFLDPDGNIIEVEGRISD